MRFQGGRNRISSPDQIGGGNKSVMQIPVADQASLRLQRSRIPQTENSAAAENFEYKEIINRAKDHRREKMERVTGIEPATITLAT